MAIRTDALPQQQVKLSKEEILRYSRHLIMPEVGLDGQLKLRQAKVLMIGTGGLGWWTSTWWISRTCSAR